MIEVEQAGLRPSAVTGQDAIWARGLEKRFGDVYALRGIDISVPAGTVLGLLGPNGAGKTTAVRILTTLLSPDGGRARVAGYDVVAQAAQLRTAIGLAGQYAAVDENLTGRENLLLVGRLYHLSHREARLRADEILERFDLVKAADRTAKTYSGGMRRRLDLGASLVGRPSVLFLDEPTTGLDPRSRIGLWEVINRLVADGTTLLLTTQYLEEADRLASRIAVIDGGRIIAEGTANELKAKIGGDEAGMVDTRTLARLLDHADAANAKVVLVGDDRQLPEIEAGGSFASLVRRLDPIVLTENRRQREEWERRAIAEQRAGRSAQAVAAYEQHGRVTVTDSGSEAKAAMVAEWWISRERGEDALMWARTVRNVTDSTCWPGPGWRSRVRCPAPSWKSTARRSSVATGLYVYGTDGISVGFSIRPAWGYATGRGVR